VSDVRRAASLGSGMRFAYPFGMSPPRHLRSMEGTTYQLGKASLAFKPSETETEGAYSVVELLEPPGANVDMHRHPGWEETFVVLEGCFEFEVSGKRHTLGPAETLVVPRGAPHGFMCTSEKAGRLLVLSTPSRVFEAFVADVSAANADPSIDISAVFARHDFHIGGGELSARKPRHFRPMEGQSYQLGRMKMAFKRTAGDEDGAYSIVESTETPGAGAGRHRHPTFQETFIVLEGSFDFEASDERRSMGPGEMIAIPRGAPHGFKCTSEEPGRLLTISIPARFFETSIAEVCAAKVDTGTPGGGPAVDMRAIAARHGVEFL
jgi:quercetin dioxygenase-like cupin family protein